MIPTFSNHDRKALIAIGIVACIGIVSIWFEQAWLFTTVFAVPLIIAVAFGEIKLKTKTMAVKITPLDKEDHFSVNGKTIYKDMNGNWIATSELTNIEKTFWQEYLELIKNENLPATPEATYTY